MKLEERNRAIILRQKGYSINQIITELGVSKSSVSIWVRDVELTKQQTRKLALRGHNRLAIEARRQTRLNNELAKRNTVIKQAKSEINRIDIKQLKLIGVMLYWAEGGKTQRMVRFSNGDPEMIKIMMAFFRKVCDVPEQKFRGYIHIHPHLNHKQAEKYWVNVTGIPLNQFFKTYRKKNKSSQNKKDSLPNGVLDVYVLDTRLFLEITGWAKGIFSSY